VYVNVQKQLVSSCIYSCSFCDTLYTGTILSTGTDRYVGDQDYVATSTRAESTRSDGTKNRSTSNEFAVNSVQTVSLMTVLPSADKRICYHTGCVQQKA